MTASAQECLACSADINLITAAKLLAKLQQLWCYSVWLRLFWRQLQLTFCTSRWPQSYQSSMSALPPKADICSALAYVRFGPEADTGSSKAQINSKHVRQRIRFGPKADIAPRRY